MNLNKILGVGLFVMKIDSNLLSVMKENLLFYRTKFRKGSAELRNLNSNQNLSEV